jgi:cold-inducible RNA-binding protein
LDNKKKVYVGNLSYTVTTDELRKMFTEFGEVIDATVITDKMSGRSKGFGFVEYGEEEMAQKAVDEMNGKEVDGRKLVVNFARPPREQ